jgi:hypothetical protein
MNIKKEALQDAGRMVKALHLEDEIANKVERLNNYGEIFDTALARGISASADTHLKRMNKLRDRLDKISTPPSKIARLVKLGVLVGGALYIANEAGYLTKVNDKLRGKLDAERGKHA